MNVSDPIADMLTRVRNALMARHEYVLVPASQVKIAIAYILKEEGFIRDYEVLRDMPQRMLRIWLNYREKKEPVLSGLKRVSKPGMRIYARSKAIPAVYGGLGVAILSTPRGIMTGQEARRHNLGGEVLCFIW